MPKRLYLDEDMKVRVLDNAFTRKSIPEHYGNVFGMCGVITDLSDIESDFQVDGVWYTDTLYTVRFDTVPEQSTGGGRSLSLDFYSYELEVFADEN